MCREEEEGAQCVLGNTFFFLGLEFEKVQEEFVADEGSHVFQAFLAPCMKLRMV